MTKPATWHGSPYDRGAADSWYRRIPKPHYYDGHRRVEANEMLKSEIDAYYLGFSENEEADLHKDYR